MLASQLVVCEALLADAVVPSHRLDRAWAEQLGLTGDLVLDAELALRVVAHGPLEGGL